MGDESQNQEDTLAGAAGKPKNPPKREPTERERMMADLDKRIEEARVKDDEDFLKGADPRAAALYAEMGREAKGQQVQTDLDPVEAEAIVDGEQQATDDAAEAEAAAAVRISKKGADPLAEYVVRDKAGKAMFKTRVDGRDVLIPLEQARAQLQKHLAADARLEAIAKQRKELEARERQVQATEATLRTRAHQAEATPIDDTALDTEATELVRALVSRPEAEAAKALANTLKKVRQAPGPRINEDEIVNRAVLRAKQEIAEHEQKRALESGFTEFTATYPDIAADSKLFDVADRATTAIAEEHPDWSPSKVMMEAGKQTRDWMQSLGVISKPTSRTPAEPNRRQEAKSKLQPMPQSRSVRPEAAADPNAADDPQGYLAAIREARGQAS